MMEPQVKFAMVPVSAPARSEAMKTAALATSSRIGSRPSAVPFSMYVLASVASAGHVSGRASGRKHTTRIPCGPSSPAKLRERASIAAHAVAKPPVKWYLRSRPDSAAAEDERVRMTPERLGTMCRAAAVAVRKCVVTPVRIGSVKSSHGIWMSGVPCRSPRIQIALNEISILPVCLTIAARCCSMAS